MESILYLNIAEIGRTGNIILFFAFLVLNFFLFLVVEKITWAFWPTNSRSFFSENQLFKAQKKGISPVKNKEKEDFSEIVRIAGDKFLSIDIKVGLNEFIEEFGLGILRLPRKAIKKIFQAFGGKKVRLGNGNIQSVITEWTDTLRATSKGRKHNHRGLSVLGDLWYYSSLSEMSAKSYAAAIVQYSLGTFPMENYRNSKETKDALNEGKIIVISRPWWGQSHSAGLARTFFIFQGLLMTPVLLLVGFVLDFSLVIFVPPMILSSMLVVIFLGVNFICTGSMKRDFLAFGKEGVFIFARYHSSHRQYYGPEGNYRVSKSIEYNANILWGFPWKMSRLLQYYVNWNSRDSLPPYQPMIEDGPAFRSELSRKTASYTIGITGLLPVPIPVPEDYMTINVYDRFGLVLESPDKIEKIEYQTGKLAFWELEMFKNPLPPFLLVETLESCQII